MADHPLQPIRNGICEVYEKAMAEGDEPVRMVALVLLAELQRLARKASLPPIGRRTT